MRRLLCWLGFHYPIVHETLEDGGCVTFYYWCSRMGCKWTL